MLKARRRGKRRTRGSLPDLSRVRTVAGEMAQIAWRLRKEAVRQKGNEDGAFERELFAWALRLVEMIGLFAAAGDPEADDLRDLFNVLLYPPQSLELQR